MRLPSLQVYKYAAVGLVVAYLLVKGFSMKKQDDLKLRYFSASEFGAWWLLMSHEQLLKLDAFRAALGRPIIVSPAMGSLGRYLGGDNNSQHNVTKWGEVRATDIMFPWMKTVAELENAYEIAKQVGFTGIGVYPDWKPYMGLHVDVREDRAAGNPALWSAKNISGKQEYFAVAEVFA